MTETAECPQPEVTMDFEQAALFVEALTGSRETVMTWCLLHDKKLKTARPVNISGTLQDLSPRLISLNKGGYGIFVAVNEVKPNARRTRDNITAVRALFVESDNGALKETALAPSFGSQSARGNHVYWKLSPDEPLALFEPAQKHLAAYFASDPTVCDLPRLMRVPGFFHQKGEPFLVRFMPGCGAAYTVADVLKAHPISPEQVKAVAKKAPKPAQKSSLSAGLPSELPLLAERKLRAEKYLKAVPGAIEGEGGDCHTFKVACQVVRDFALDGEDALDVMRPWNATCVPPWDEQDLMQKVASALQHGAGPIGSKLIKQLPDDPDYLRALVADDAIEENCQPEQIDRAEPAALTDAPGEQDAPPMDDEGISLEEFEDLPPEALEDPYHLQLLTIMAQDPAQLRSPEVVKRLARLQDEDPIEFERCMIEVKANTRGMLRSLNNHIKFEREQNGNKNAGLVEKASKTPIIETFPEAKGVVGDDHLPPFSYDIAWHGVGRLVEDKDEDGAPCLKSQTICDNPLVISRCADKLDGSGTLMDLAFRTRENGKWHKVMAPRDVVMTARLLNTLAIHRVPVNSDNSAKLVKYLSAYETTNEKVIPRSAAATQMGWQGKGRALGFLVGRRQITPSRGRTGKVEFATDAAGDAQLVDSFHQKGKWETWCEAFQTITRYPRVHVGVLASLSTPLLDLLDLSNYMLEYSGETSSGKTTAARFAASVWAATGHQHSIMRSWNTTQIGMERYASMVSGLPMIVDESNEAQTVFERQALAKLIYQLVNGRGRSRGTRTLNVQQTKVWHTVIISTGEHPITSNTQDAGTRARVLALEDSPFGGTNEQTGQDVDMCNAVAAHHYGHAGPRFVQWLVNNMRHLESWKRRHAELVTIYSRGTLVPMGVGKRLAGHLALLDLTGELMVQALEFRQPYVSPVAACLPAVMQSAREVDRPKDALIDVISSAYAQRARFFGAGNYDAMTGCIGKRAADAGGVACLALTGDFVRQVLTNLGHNNHRVGRAWTERGWVIGSSDGKATRVVRIDGDAIRCFCIPEAVVDEVMPLEQPPGLPVQPPSTSNAVLF